MTDRAANTGGYGPCCEDGCPYDASFESPKWWCDWHWHLWFAFGDEDVAREIIRDTRALRAPTEILDAGRQCPIPYPVALVRDGNPTPTDEDERT